MAYDLCKDNIFFCSSIYMAELIIFLGLFGLLLIVLLMSKTNNLKKKYNKTTEAFGGVDAYLQQRYDLIPNLIASVKKLMEYESELFTELAKLNTLSKQHDIPIQEKIRINSQIDTRYSQVQVFVNEHPQISANEQVSYVMSEWVRMEDNILAARRVYNSNVTEYNDAYDSFPNSLIANLIGLDRAVVFEAVAEARVAPKGEDLWN